MGGTRRKSVRAKATCFASRGSCAPRGSCASSSHCHSSIRSSSRIPEHHTGRTDAKVLRPSCRVSCTTESGTSSGCRACSITFGKEEVHCADEAQHVREIQTKRTQDKPRRVDRLRLCAETFMRETSGSFMHSPCCLHFCWSFFLPSQAVLKLFRQRLGRASVRKQCVRVFL